mmetsp:Transcript_3291/g.20496  ORF Transcript_3291/g.20496 Transcript_3291/m.20496 type:complete len:604 (-) Transcript_3291:313-2124(-)|eukprot:CAMPEP_0183826368 /NCGR_PEP_ID=MMETSP0807_2-20130328/1656_1 /TAXON_ID=88271 /ORGANISM="Picocystis salinarum, Strain CCMP1897" /LENGTH=603 /DNA_ID=CAMNT_0026071477 /DNA_START=111 /DNA_END=1922 /DNA_ORIENTATION=-
MACRLGNMWKQAFAMLVLAVTLGSHGARGEECQTILQVAEEANLNSLIAALNAAGLNVPIQDTDSSFTVMAPTDAAFDSLLEDLDMTFAELAANETLLSTVLGYHALPPNLPENLAGPVPTLTGQDLFVNFTGKVVGENVTIEAGPVPACLAQIYVIDAVLVPENFTCTPLADVALAENLTLFLEVVNQTDFSEVNVSPLRTVFAPTNEAIANFLSEYNVTLTGENEDLGFLAQVLAYHSVETFILPDGWGEFETINGQQLPVNFSDGTVGDNVNIISGQQIACLSQLFVIDGVLIPNDTACPSIYDFAKESGFDVLVELVDAAGLAPFLSNIVNRFSVFAPSDAAFADLLPYGITTEVLKQNTTLLSEILKYHIVPGYLPPGVLGEFETMFGEKLSLNLPGRKVEKDVNITLSANVCTSKVNAIDAVLTPSGLTCPSVAQLAETLGLEDLVQALNATDLIAPLSAPNIISTVFAPTNEAFNTTLTELGLTFDDLLANTTRLTEILSYHVIGRILPPTADDKFETLDGIELAVDLPEKKVGDNVNITAEEPVQACLSQVYVIDAVLIPRGQQDSGNSKLLFSLKGLVISSWVQIGLLIFGLRI